MSFHNGRSNAAPDRRLEVRGGAYSARSNDADPLPLSHYGLVLYRNRWRIGAFVAFCIVVTLIACLRTQPIYESTARMDVDRRAPTGIIGQDSVQAPPTNDADQFLTTQIELIESDGVLRPVAEKFHLLKREKQLETDPKTAAQIAKAPITLRRLKVVRPPNSLFLRITYRSTDPQLASDVANDIARSYLERTYDIRVKSTLGLSAFMERQIDGLRAKMVQSGEALAIYERELSVINPEDKTNILSARLLQLNTEYTNAQSERVRKEAASASLVAGALAAIQISPQAMQLAHLEEKMHDAQARLAELKATYGPNYADYRRSANEVAELTRQYSDATAQVTQRIEVDYRQAMHREQMLKKAVAETKAEYDHLNMRSFQYQQLKREAEADKNLYEELLRKIKEAGINAGFQNNSIRIADYARPAAKPVFPQTSQMVFLSFLLSTLVACAAAIVADLLDTTLNDPDRAKQMLHVDVVAMLPEVRSHELLRTSPQLAELPAAKTLSLRWRPQNSIWAQDESTQSQAAFASYEESIRTLRNSITLVDFGVTIKSILITSATPSEGKSTTAAHLAMAHAEQNKKTLLIDADLRRPTQHTRFGTLNDFGLSTALTGAVVWKDALVKPRPFLHILPAGPQMQRAADLIGPLMVELIKEASQEYDLVIIDAPMLPGLADPLQMAAATDGVVVVAHSGRTSKKAVAGVLTCLERVEANVVGLVLNRVTGKVAETYYSDTPFVKSHAAAGVRTA